MSTARAESLTPEPTHRQIVRRTVEACRLAKDAAGAAAEGIATGSSALLNSLRQRERELDTFDMEIDSAVTGIITLPRIPRPTLRSSPRLRAAYPADDGRGRDCDGFSWPLSKIERGHLCGAHDACQRPDRTARQTGFACLAVDRFRQRSAGADKDAESTQETGGPATGKLDRVA